MALRPDCLKLVTRPANRLSCALTELVGTAAPIVAIGALGLLTVAQSNPAHAATSLQTFNSTDTFTAFSPASASSATYNSVLPQFTVQPFDSGIGTLSSTGIIWNTVVSFTGTSGTADGSGTVSILVGGQYYVDSIAYSGLGGGGGNGAASGTTFSANPSSITRDTQFSNPASGYNPAILPYFLGSTPFTITSCCQVDSLTTPYKFTYSNIESGSATFTTTASVTYNYVAAPSVADAPGPLPLLGAGAAWGWSRQLRRRCAQRQG